MTGLPLLLVSTQPTLGPLVPTQGKPKQVTVEGLKSGDQVWLLGTNDGEVKEVLETISVDIMNHHCPRTKDFKYVQARRQGDSGSPVSVWVN